MDLGSMVDGQGDRSLASYIQEKLSGLEDGCL